MADKATKTGTMERAVGRRKTAAARVRLMPGKGIITINGRPLEDYFPLSVWQEKVVAPLAVANREKELDVTVRVAGGGVSGQADAVRHGIARALIKWNEDLRPVLRAEGLLTRDQRAKERKKPGLHRARRGHQWRKR
ncbi:MAG: 30S ribosomal protein S9 [Candidatus Magasanikbacteria bacterium GW2011_GWA2_56_11]|uniref:Small ribosomal subunit protein uS9 n=1 Tax=Candidatus Magasanikbacteria bacterium GW2011_GWA2_56_11 TaxID=1619044 RepID=A0A0G1YEN3_9BACT|nr:MAG: 30S ribosomal protein S9 [Candidatus Magasanikbacteria bacterium GW2011_GWA2_56_11]